MPLSADIPFILKATLTSSTPLLLAGYGELLSQRAGTINVGIEGLMLIGAAAGYATASLAHSHALIFPAAALAAILFALLFALASILFRADQIVAGTALNILAAGVTTTLYAFLQKHPDADDALLFDRLNFPTLANIPWIGPALFNQYSLFYFTILLAIALVLITRLTRVGLVVRALGDNPDACNAAGIPVRLHRTLALLFAAATAGLAGAYLSTCQTHKFLPNMTAGKGFLVLALVIFGRWNLLYFTAGTLLFGALDALQSILASKENATTHLPHQLFPMLPYLATLIALAVLSKSTATPRTLAQPWPPER